LPSPHKQGIPETEFHKMIEQVARGLSRQRKAEPLGDPVALDRMPSTGAEMETDWRHAVVFWLDYFMIRGRGLGELDSACYYHFENIWLEDVKEFWAYFHWINTREEEVFWTPRAKREAHYNRACDALRAALVSPGAKAPPDSFSRPEQYIRNKYLPGGTPSGPDVDALIRRKAERIKPWFGWEGAFGHAGKFVRTFYGNIIAAVRGDGDVNAVSEILTVVQYGGTSLNAWDIVNGFELLLMVLFLDSTHIESAYLANPAIRHTTL